MCSRERQRGSYTKNSPFFDLKYHVKPAENIGVFHLWFKVLAILRVIRDYGQKLKQSLLGDSLHRHCIKSTMMVNF